ncbi:MAG: cytochrome c family protein [Chloroflexi bacterium]|nr:cytochrome c family protein [Chloroflexota bacterium]
MHKKHIGFLLLVTSALALIAALTWPRPAAAQCGSSASSCKSCHETQAKDPVSTKGAWHSQHAFGDFCEFCHAGNVKAKDEASAHAGLIDPLADVKGSCQSCHPNDYEARAQTYASALGKTIGAATAPSGAAPAGAGAITTTVATHAVTTTAAAVAPCGPAEPTGGQTIDLNKAYAGLNLPPPNILGNLAVVGLIVVMLLVLGGLVWYYERPFERLVLTLRRWQAMPVLVSATPEGAALNLPKQLVARPELEALLPLLAANDPATLDAVTRLLSDREKGPKVLKAIGRADLRSLAALSESDQKALAALLALAKEMKA